MSLPPLGSIDPKDTIKRACVVWSHSESIPCEKCGKPALVGTLGRKQVATACHRCGPTQKSPTR
jgi:hypothetical protein